jgi:hypothetical protein
VVGVDIDTLHEAMRRARAREVLAHIEFLRCARQLNARGITQTELADRCRVSQPGMRQMLLRAQDQAPDVRPGTHGGTAFEIAVRCAAGEIDRATMRRELIGWKYDRYEGPPNPYADLNDVPPIIECSFKHQVGRAYSDGFLNAEDYDLILNALADD